MSRITTSNVRKWVTLGMTLVLVISLITWLWQRDRLPNEVRIATGLENGLYYKVGSTIRDSLSKRISSTVTVLPTDGSKTNFQLLGDKEADLALVQGGSVKIEDVSVITPLFREFVFVIARKGTSIQSVWDLRGKSVCLGQAGSGNRDAAIKVLKHFGLDEGDLKGDNDFPFSALANDPSIDAAIVTAGIEHPRLKILMLTHQFEIVPIRSAVAIELVHPFVRNVEVPRGLFAEHPAVPPEPIPTIATTAFLVCRNDASNDLVQSTLQTIHEESMRLRVPTLIPRQDAMKWTVTRMHPTAKRYFNPEDNLGEMLSVMESLVATKELLFALGAGIYLLWIRWRRLKEKELEETVHQQKEHLDQFLMETLRIEKEQMQTDDPEKLQGYIESVTRIKLQALKELTEEELRGNQEFSIFLDQCSYLISRIQMKMYSLRSADPRA